MLARLLRTGVGAGLLAATLLVSGQNLGLPDGTLRWEVREWATRPAIKGHKVDYGGGLAFDTKSKATEWTEVMPLDVTVRGEQIEVDGRYTAQTEDGHNLNRLRLIFGLGYQMVYNYALAEPKRRFVEPYGVMLTPTSGHGAYAAITAEATPMVTAFEMTFLAGTDPTHLFYLTPNAYFTTKERWLEYSTANLDTSMKSTMFGSQCKYVLRDNERGEITGGEFYEVGRKIEEFVVKERAKIGGRVRPCIVVCRRYTTTAQGLKPRTISTYTLKRFLPVVPLDYGIPSSLQVVDYRLATPDVGRSQFPLPEDKPIVYKWSGSLPSLDALRGIAAKDAPGLDPKLLLGGATGLLGVLLLVADFVRRRSRPSSNDLPAERATNGSAPSEGNP